MSEAIVTPTGPIDGVDVGDIEFVEVDGSSFAVGAFACIGRHHNGVSWQSWLFYTGDDGQTWSWEAIEGVNDTAYAVPGVQGDEYNFMDSSASSAIVRNIAIVPISTRKFVALWCEDGGNSIYSEHPYVAARVGFVHEDLSITYGTPLVLFEETDVATVGIAVAAVSTGNESFFVAIREFLVATGDDLYALRGVACAVSAGNSIQGGGVQNIEGPSIDTADRIQSASLVQFASGTVGLVYTQGDPIDTLTDCITRIITASGNSFGFGSAITHTIGTDITGSSMQAFSSTTGVLTYIEGGITTTRRLFERSGSSFIFGSPFTMSGGFVKVTEDTFANVLTNQVRVGEIDWGTLSTGTLGSFVNWHSISLVSLATLLLEDDQLILFGTTGGALYANGVSVSGTVATVPVGIATNLGALRDGSFRLLGDGVVVGAFNDEIFSPEYSEFATAYVVTYSGSDANVNFGTDVKALGLSVDRGTGSFAWITLLSNDNSELWITAWGLNPIGLFDGVPLGPCTESELDAGDYVAYPLSGWGGRIYIFGRMKDPQSLGDPAHIINFFGGAWVATETGWGTDICGGLVTSAVGDVYAIRNIPGGARLYTGNSGGVLLRSTSPLNDGINPRAIAQDQTDGTIIIGSRSGDNVMVVASATPFMDWYDLTTDHGVVDGITALEIL